MKYQNIKLLIVFLGLSLHGYAQDIHFTLFDYAPLAINPANVGAYEGTARVGGIYRSQERGGYTTPLIYVDSPLLSVGKKKLHWIGAGLNLYQDQAGIAELNTRSIALAAAYHHALDLTYRNVVSLGANIGFLRRSATLSGDNILLEDEIIGGGNSPDRNNYNNQVNYQNVGLGLGWKSKLSDKSSLNAGVGVRYLTQPDYNLGNSPAQLDPRIQAFAQYRHLISSKFMLTPMVYHTTLSKSHQTQVQLLGSYLAPKRQTIDFGVGYRIEDAILFRLGYHIGDFTIGLGYDLTVSDLKEYNKPNAFELALGYTIKRTKTVEVDPVIVCPHL